MPNPGRRRWRVKDTVFSAWRELSGSHTPGEVWKMRREGRFAMARSLEASVCRQLCKGDITLKDGEAICLEPDWTRAYLRYFGMK